MCSKNLLFLSVLSWVGGVVAAPEVKESLTKTLGATAWTSAGATYRYASYYPRAVSTSEKNDVQFWTRLKSEYVDEPFLFGGMYFALELGAKKISENDSVKQFTQDIPPFVGENLKFALAAGAARAVNTIRLDGKEGVNSKNLQDFGKGMVFQVAGEAAKECIVKPAVDHILGSEESLTKDALNIVGVLMVTGVIFSTKY